MNRVELVPAFVFDCPSCGAEGVQRAVTRFLDPADEDTADAIADRHGEDTLDACLDGESAATVRTPPDSVQCKNCGEVFAPVVAMPGQPIDGDDEEDDE